MLGTISCTLHPYVKVHHSTINSALEKLCKTFPIYASKVKFGISQIICVVPIDLAYAELTVACNMKWVALKITACSSQTICVMYICMCSHVSPMYCLWHSSKLLWFAINLMVQNHIVCDDKGLQHESFRKVFGGSFFQYAPPAFIKGTRKRFF